MHLISIVSICIHRQHSPSAPLEAVGPNTTHCVMSILHLKLMLIPSELNQHHTD